jgi:small subunit ribosomal protein S8
MSMSDPIADMLTRIRNAFSANHEATVVPFSRMKAEIARVLKREGYITDYVVEGSGVKKNLRVYLKYGVEDQPAITVINRLSKPGLRKYSDAAGMPKALGGMGTVILSTSSGLMTDKEARKQNVGGELLCEVW